MQSPLPESIDCERFHLRRLCGRDVAELYRHFSDSAVMEYLDFDPLTSMDGAVEIVAWADDIHDRGVGVRWAVRSAESGSFLGTCGFNSIVRARGCRGEIAYDLSRQYWGQGIMREVLPSVLTIGFQTLGLNRLQAFVTPGNTRSVRLLERHGFRHEGRLREYGAWRGGYWDQDLYALLRREWANRGRSAPPGARPA